MSRSLKEGKPASHFKDSIIILPYKIKMHIYNESEDTLEFFVIKVPSPKFMKS